VVATATAASMALVVAEPALWPRRRRIGDGGGVGGGYAVVRRSSYSGRAAAATAAARRRRGYDGGGGGGGSIIDSSAITNLAEVSGIASPDGSPNGEIIIVAFSAPPPALTNIVISLTNPSLSPARTKLLRRPDTTPRFNQLLASTWPDLEQQQSERATSTPTRARV